MARVSVVIPCFNQGHYLQEAVDSVLAQTFTDFEIIIVNDGSTDPATNSLLEDYHMPGCRVVTTDNQGLAAARNNGIAAASGEYILPLDADDRIGPRYLELAVEVLEKQPEVGIVYCLAGLFGAVETDWALPEYSLQRMLLDNVIFCSAMFRREDWEISGGYDPGMIYGWEDYEFWLGLLERGMTVVRLDEQLFFYRIAGDSMVRSKGLEQKVEMFCRAYHRHQQLFSDNIQVWANIVLASGEKYYTSRLYVDCGRGMSDAESVPRKVEAITQGIVFRLDGITGIRALRFDPLECPAVVSVESMLLSYSDGTEKEVTRFYGNAALVKENKMYFHTNDPQCFPRLPWRSLGASRKYFEGLTAVTVKFKFHSLEEQALRDLIGLQIGTLDSLPWRAVSLFVQKIMRKLESLLRR